MAETVIFETENFTVCVPGANIYRAKKAAICG